MLKSEIKMSHTFDQMDKQGSSKSLADSPALKMETLCNKPFMFPYLNLRSLNS